MNLIKILFFTALIALPTLTHPSAIAGGSKAGNKAPDVHSIGQGGSTVGTLSRPMPVAKTTGIRFVLSENQAFAVADEFYKPFKIDTSKEDLSILLALIADNTNDKSLSIFPTLKTALTQLGEAPTPHNAIKLLKQSVALYSKFNAH